MNKRSYIMIMVVFIVGCSSNRALHNKKSFYQQLGADKTLSVLSKELAKNLINNAEIGFLFEHADEKDFSSLLFAQICLETGGKCDYKGLSMKDAHSGMNINSREFDIFVDIFIKTMRDVGWLFTA